MGSIIPFVFVLLLCPIVLAVPPELPTLLYGQVLDADLFPLEVTVDAQWIDSNGGHHTTVSDSSNDLQYNMRGYYFFNKGYIKAKRDSFINISSGGKSVLVKSSPGKGIIKVGPIVQERERDTIQNILDQIINLFQSDEIIYAGEEDYEPLDTDKKPPEVDEITEEMLESQGHYSENEDPPVILEADDLKVAPLNVQEEKTVQVKRKSLAGNKSDILDSVNQNSIYLKNRQEKIKLNYLLIGYILLVIGFLFLADYVLKNYNEAIQKELNHWFMGRIVIKFLQFLKLITLVIVLCVSVPFMFILMILRSISFCILSLLKKAKEFQLIILYIILIIIVYLVYRLIQ